MGLWLLTAAMELLSLCMSFTSFLQQQRDVQSSNRGEKPVLIRRHLVCLCAGRKTLWFLCPEFELDLNSVLCSKSPPVTTQHEHVCLTQICALEYLAELLSSDRN